MDDLCIEGRIEMTRAPLLFTSAITITIMMISSAIVQIISGGDFAIEQ
jgi:hypothetical protein